MYVDTDCESIEPLRNFIWPNASVVSGTDLLGELHQWVLIFVPSHEIMLSALQLAVHRTTKLLLSNSGGSVMHMTGPETYNKAVVHVMRKWNCDAWRALHQNRTDDMTAYSVYYYDCHPRVGVMQIYKRGLGNKIKFKSDGVGGEKGEMYSSSQYYQTTERKFSTLFRHVLIQKVEGDPNNKLKIGNCSITSQDILLLNKLTENQMKLKEGGE